MTVKRLTGRFKGTYIANCLIAQFVKPVLYWSKDVNEMDLIVAALLLIFLMVSTLGWAIVYSRHTVGGRVDDDDLARTRLWASAVPLGVILVLIATSFLALFSSHPIGGVASLRYALGMWPSVVGLVLWGGVTVIPLIACVRAWRTLRWTTLHRMHMSAFLGALIAVIVLLLSARQ